MLKTINMVMVYNRKVPVKNRHSNKRFHYTRKKGKWKPKHPFDNQEAAEGFIIKYRMIERNYVSYFCPHCCKWHIGRSETEDTKK